MTDIALSALGVLIFALGLAISIALHEIGHLVPAKRFGVKCTQYMIGFGPTVWSRKVGETEYGIKAIPLGGYVRMLGMFPPRRGDHGQPQRLGRLGLMVEQARAVELDRVGPEDGDRLFYQRSVPKRLVIMLGGPTMNLVLAIGLIAGVLTTIGMQQTVPVLETVNECVVPYDQPAEKCGPEHEPAPAAEAGLRPGDEIVAINGRAVREWGDVQRAIRGSAGTPITLQIERAGQPTSVTLTPKADERPRIVDGRVVEGPDGQPVTDVVGFAGVVPAWQWQRQPVSEVPGIIGTQLQHTARIMVRIPEKLVGVAQAAFGTAERDPEGPISVVGVGRIAGEIGTLEAPGKDKLAFWLMLLASLNLALFVFNLIPLLPLDGGHAAGAVWEGIRRQAARLRRRPDPGPVDVARALPLAYGVAAALIGLTLLLVYADLVSPIRLTG